MEFKDWLKVETMTPEEAEEILGVKRGDPDLAGAYRRASVRHHPDRGGNTSDMKRVNAAFELLNRRSHRKNPSKSGSPFRGNATYANLNYCKYVIEEKSKQNGQVSPYTFYAWDGMVFRGVFTVNTNPKSFGFAGMVMEQWNNSFPHHTKAVFVDLGAFKTLLLVRLNGEDVSGQKREFEHDSFNDNPENDMEFLKMLRMELY